ncbi:hypothetical protein BP6252_13442 [Coleophoma cylindrospora]|uniref:rRNA methyltransferase 1, mitochondrial n=1 Tax=Coleophoma cylindrospora TaxID=1849047 RepID=A0A3D8Q8A0_9HELO|nr:hypothetical protein BP6252_13442 [Coleophoma cylindrospora]
MSQAFLPRSRLNLRAGSITLPLLYPGLHSIRAASINSAINKGLRRTKGIGFRGKDRPTTDRRNDGDYREKERKTADAPDLVEVRKTLLDTRLNWDGKGKFSRSVAAKKAGVDLKSLASVRIHKGKRPLPDPLLSKIPRKTRSARFHDPDDPLGKNSVRFKEKLAAGELRPWKEKMALEEEKTFDKVHTGRAGGKVQLDPETLKWMNSGRGIPDAFTQFYSTKVGKLSMNPRFKNDLRSHEQSFSQPTHSDSHAEADASSSLRGSQGLSSRPIPAADKHAPLSVPYSTSASEFLYGTSVVQAALASRKVPGRKLYKLYIYTGENREDAGRDDKMESLARKNGVPVARVDATWLRTLDKMSGGRPHNGYVLEASPLPKLPIKSLGDVIKGEQPGYKVVLDYQSREDAEINGTSDFIQLPRSNRNPFILLLDEIVDPGNLGGMIRTASFLGVTAVAISVRNSASFTPIVLKASAGASENITIFAVEKPAGFVADSRLAGWKVYAAIAPSSPSNAVAAHSVTTEELGDPLAEDPCILVLGSEGYGLRPNLKQHADVHLSIQGSGRSAGVDSLNVSVAAGILCSSFLKGNTPARPRNPTEKAQPEARANKVF